MGLGPRITTRVSAETPASSHAGLVIFVGLQLVVAAGLGNGFVIALSNLRDEPNTLVPNFHLYPADTAIGVVVLVAGLLVTAVSGTGLLMRKLWAPFLYVAWLVLAVIVNYSHPHRLFLLLFPFILYPLVIAGIYIHLAFRNRLSLQSRGEALGPALVWLKWATVTAMLLCAFAFPGNFVFAATAWTYGFLRGDKVGRGLTLISTLALALSVVAFVGLVQKAFSVPT